MKTDRPNEMTIDVTIQEMIEDGMIDPDDSCLIAEVREQLRGQS